LLWYDGDYLCLGKGGKKAAAAAESAAPASDDKVDVSHLDFRIGKIVEVQKHPDADTLYVETVDLGEEKPRTIVSGLVNHIPIEQVHECSEYQFFYYYCSFHYMYNRDVGTFTPMAPKPTMEPGTFR
jgi:hypothetical protein